VKKEENFRTFGNILKYIGFNIWEDLSCPPKLLCCMAM